MTLFRCDIVLTLCLLVSVSGCRSADSEAVEAVTRLGGKVKTRNRYLLEQVETLGGCEVSDRGLVYLHPLRELRAVFLHDTLVTEAGVAALKGAIPGCEVFR